MNIIRDSPNIDGSDHGGVKRSNQLRDILKDTKCPFLEVRPFDYEPSKLKRLVSAAAFVFRHGFPFAWRLSSVRYVGTQYAAYRRRLDPIQHDATYLWETTSDLLGFFTAREKGFRIIAVPQNLEALIGLGPMCARAGSVLGYLDREVRCLKGCAKVFCISKEEQWFLRNLGISAEFLPYYPTGNHLQALVDIRTVRMESPPEQDNYLVLGNGHYPPSRLGILQLLDMLSVRAFAGPITCHVVGRGTEQFVERFRPAPNIIFHGFLPAQQFALLLSQVSALLVYQDAGAGALTRIADMIVAGLPVIGNSIACRSYHGFPGVYSWDSPEELQALLGGPVPVPPMPPPPTAAIQRFIDCVMGKPTCLPSPVRGGTADNLGC